jgi:hypothetical protein
MTDTLARIAHRHPGLFIIAGIIAGWAIVAGIVALAAVAVSFL